jgi:phosphoglycolate phosphatase-like HAD superfamily hydrolase
MHVVLFDIDGTLISSGGAGRAALELGLAEEHGRGPLSRELVLSGRTDPAILSDVLRLAGLPDTPEGRERLRAAYLRHLPGRMAAHTRDEPPSSPYHARVLPGVVELLERLRAREVALGLLTGNVRAGARIKLGHFGLFERFAFGGFGDRHHDRDDVAREALAEARRHCPGPVRAERVWVVGDTPLDVRCARAIGARAVAVVTGWHGHDELAASGPDLLLDDLADAAGLLEALGAA